jgi:hypothetical protein
VGEWDWAIATLEERRPIETDPIARGVVLTDLHIFRTLRGEPAQDLVAEVTTTFEGEADSSVGKSNLYWIRLLEAMVADDPVEAGANARLVADTFQQAGPEAYLLAGHAAIRARNTDAATRFLAAVDESTRRGRAIDNERASLRAGVAALEGRVEEAHSSFGEVLRTWRDLGCVWDEAVTALEPSLPDVREAAVSARETFTRLGARPMVEKLDAALARTPEKRPPKVPAESVPAA